MIERARGNAVRSQDRRALAGVHRRRRGLAGVPGQIVRPEGSARCRCNTGRTLRRAWPRSAACCVRGRALVWDFRTGRVPLHGQLPDPVEHAHDFTSRDRRNAMALAMAVQAPPADRARAQLRRTRTHDILDRAPTPARLDEPRCRGVRLSTPPPRDRAGGLGSGRPDR
jgi:hypothetical protein